MSVAALQTQSMWSVLYEELGTDLGSPAQICPCSSLAWCSALQQERTAQTHPAPSWSNMRSAESLQNAFGAQTFCITSWYVQIV